MALSSPGVEVKVIDESFYTPAAPGTVPMIFVATAENKLNGAGDGIAPGTLKANAGQPYLITSQKDLVDTFGDPMFKTDANGNPVHAGEQNEYGLQAAYSLLGVSNRAFVVRADIDLNQITPSVNAPAARPNNGTYWLDTKNTKWGIFEWDASPVTSNGQKFVNKEPIVITDNTKLDSLGAPTSAIGKVGSYAIVAIDVSPSTPQLSDSHPMSVWFKNSSGQWVQVGSQDWEDSFTSTPLLAIQSHTQVPQWKSTGSTPAPSGSVWIKTTEPNLGARWRVSRYNSATQLFENTEAPIFGSAIDAFYFLDRAGGGQNLAIGNLYTKFINNAGVSFKVYRRKSLSPTQVKTPSILSTTFDDSATYTFSIFETRPGSQTLSGGSVTFTTGSVVTAASNAAAFATAINSAGLNHVSAEVDGQNRVVITHDLGGDIHFSNGTLTPLTAAGFVPFNPNSGAGMIDLYADDDGDHDFVASLWEPLVYFANENAPTSLTENGTLWYSSVIDEIDIMVHNGTTWVGYQNGVPGCNPTGPIVSATAPELQVDGTPLVTGDLWIDTSDIENFPTIYKFNAELLNAPIVRRWILVDKSDQSTEDGIVFADARYNTAGTNSDVAGTIRDLLVSDYLDPDAPDPALYPRGMLLWNLRRSGFNVKEFKLNYIDTTVDNPRFGGGESMADYYPHRWVTVSSNQDDGSGSFGRKAQRKVVVQALQAMVNSNQEIRDDEGRIFNLLACPGYPELIGEMINLNFDRGLTAFVIGDTPARLTPDATSLLRWGNNELLALEDNDIGAASFDEYMGMFYPWGFTSDNFGNNVVVPPSHMILRTIALNDQVAYPWFAPAGVRRGGISNATAVGYVDSTEGEFKAVALNNGQRDTLQEVKINPITFFTGVGLVNYGQKTRARAASALDRINVARLVIYLRRQLSVLAKPYVFEPNDKITRDELKAAVESLLLELVGQRALYDYLVVCDETNNTPSRIDRNELWIDIAIEPVKAVEFIYIPLRLKNTGEISGL